MRVLVACEESQRVCIAFRKRGHEAYSCDIQEPSGGHPEWHILGDALNAIKGGRITTMDDKTHQYIEPYMFGDPEKKKTGLWLKGLPLLKPTNIVEPVIIHCKSGANEPRWHIETMRLPKEERSRVRSQTFIGIAKAMAEQWG